MIDLQVSLFEHFKTDKKISLVIADPPDNIGKEYACYDDNIAKAKYIQLLDIWLKKCCEITTGPVFFTFNEKWISDVEASIKINNLTLIQRCWWYYTFGQHNATRYTPCVRPIYWLNNGTVYPDAIKVPSARQEKYGDKRAKDGGRMPANVWEYSRICGTFRERRKWHVVQLPEAMIKRIVLGHSREGDLVFDPFIGSGTTAYVCHETNRHCLGIDMSPQYINKITEEFASRYME